MQSVAVIGPGAIGGTLAAWLAQAPEHAVTVCVRTPLDHLQIDTPRGVIRAEPQMLSDPAQAVVVDWALVTTKAYDAEGAARWLKGLVGPETRVAVIQNGVEHVERFSSYLPAERIVPVVIDLPAERTAPGRILQRQNGTIRVPDDANGRAFAELFASTPIEATTTPDWKTAAWRKLCINSAGAVSALTIQPNGVSRREPIAAIMRDLVAECVAVGRAEGAQLEDDLPQTVVDGYRSAPPESLNSMHADRLAGRPMEIDARNGVIVRLGARHGIATPVNAMMVALLEASAGA
jgi:2-dehydropantoate 2-reductase